MDWNKYKNLRKYFKSDWDILKLCRELGGRALRMGPMKSLIKRELAEKLIDRGKTNKQIARRLRISERHVRRIRKEFWNSKGE